MIFDRAEYELRCEWDAAGVKALAPVSDVVIVVDVLSFSTAVDIADARDAQVLPYPVRGTSGRELVQRGFARDVACAAEAAVSAAAPVMREDRS